MRRPRRFWGKLAAGLLVPILIMLTLLSIFLLALNSRLFNPDFYLDVFQELELYEKLPEIAAAQISYSLAYNPCLEDPNSCQGEELDGAGPGVEGLPGYLQALSEDDWAALLTAILPPDWLEEQARAILEGLLESIDQGELAASISLQGLRDQLGSGAGTGAIRKIWEAQPPCTPQDLITLSLDLEGGDPGINFLSCRPPEVLLDALAPALGVLLQRAIPAQIDLGQYFSGTRERSSASGGEVRGTELSGLERLKSLRKLVSLSPLACISLLLVIAFLGVDSPRDLGSWWGYPLAVTGLTGLGISLLASPLLELFFEIFLRGIAGSGLSPALVESGSDLALAIFRSLFARARAYSLAVSGISLAVIIAASLVKPAWKKPAGQSLETGTDPDLIDELSQDLPLLTPFDAQNHTSGEDGMDQETS